MRVGTAPELGAAIRGRREALGWTQQQLADRMRVNRRWVTQFENGKRSVELGLVLDAVTVLGLDFDLVDGVPGDAG